MKKITPFLWFDNNAEEAINFYVNLFPGSEITNVVKYGEAGPGKPGSVMTVVFRLNGAEFIALNGGPHYQFSPAVSFAIDCADQADIDRYWDALAEGGKTMACGWLTDRFGLTWQVVPSILPRLFGSPDKAAAGRAMTAMMKMQKFIIKDLQDAFDGRD